jgi:flagellar basal-body rod protein FlgG
MIAATGIQSQQKRLDTVADNIANVNTAGFKGARLEFKDALFTAGFGPTATPEGNQQKGHGVMTMSVRKRTADGSIQVTNNKLDFALEGDGLLELEDNRGNLVYTRAGNLYSTVRADGRTYLCNSQGFYVLNEEGARIEIPEDTQDISVAEDGTIEFTTAGGPVFDKFGIYTFTNKTGLLSVGKSNFEPSAASGGKQLSADTKIMQGALENSNVDLSVEMTMLVRSQRAFSLASRALSTADEMEGIANNLRR